MNAIERTFFSSDWLTFIFIISLGLIFVMKLYKPKLLTGYSIAFFSQGFIEKRVEENPNFFSAFHAVLFLFCSLMFSVLITVSYFQKDSLTITNFGWVFLGFISYLFVRFFIDILIEKLFIIEQQTRYFRFSKVGYLYTAALWLFPILIVNNYTTQNKYLLLFLVGSLLLTRFVLIIKNNKNLIFSHFFYFILYFCTLEIAPLLIFYKTIHV